MLKSLERYLYVDDALGLKIPDSEHGFPLESHKIDDAAFVHRSLLPVSICSLSFCGGVPKLTFA